MKTLSLTQPWASLIMLDEKQWETRSWNCRHRGPLLIHASKGFPKWAKDLCKEEPFASVLAKHGLSVETLPLGAVLGKVIVQECQRTDDTWEKLSEQEYAFGNYDDGRFCFRVTEPLNLPKPIPAKGALGLWNFTEGPMPADGEQVWFAAKCRECGFVASSEYFGLDRCLDDAQDYCPLCHGTSIDELQEVA